MSMIKKVTLTINKNNTGVKLSSPLKFFKYDSFLLQFEIEQWNFETKQNELVKPMYAIAFVETPDGKDRVECTVLDGQIVQFQLLSRHTKHIGKGKLQIVVRDTHGSGEESCQSATPSFEYTVEDVIYDNYDSGILEDGPRSLCSEDLRCRLLKTRSIPPLRNASLPGSFAPVSP